ncbi:SLAP domain-containing protein [Lactobacillus amylovorus]|uniref:SLAP domain-containing protein n=1 Tax=Lactobacillus amylovorus TaxID=1604 RepID=A0A9X4ABI7_LACAM|nr:SLAP domain-containing protein [Lactobacillus amylovorus]MDB6254399.1 SLAP domain-containing protein [Lactobacillus amylovorus]MDB6258491.1 SLAP domain-containing protein [Lactobacillus amylovorus]
MKLNHKLIMVSAAALMSVSPLVANTQNSVQAATTTKSSSKTTAKKTTTSAKKATDSKSNSKSTSSKTTSKASSNNITLARNAYVYDKNGKRLDKYMGSAKYTTIAKGVTVKSNGTTKIKGVLYYSLGNNAYIKAANVVGDANASSSSKTTTSTTKKTTSTKKSTTSKTTSTKKTSTKKTSTKKDSEASDRDAIKVKLIHNAYVYDQNGKRIKKYNGKTKLTKGTTVNSYGTDTINGKDYYQLNAAGTAFVKASNVDSTSSVTITMKKNAYIYDGNGDTEKKTVKKGKKVKATEARYIGTKLYYKIGDDQFVKAANVGKVSSKLDPVNEPDGSATVDDNSSYDTNLNASIVTTIKVAPLYDIKGQADSTRSFGAGQKQQVSELRYIATSANSTPELFYKLASGRGYLKATDVTYSGKTLSPVNTPEQALTEVTVATAADKAKLTPSINEANAIKNTDAYKLASSSAKSAYDKAITDATAVNNNASATVAQVNEAIANITSAKAKLDGKKVTVANLSNLTPDEVSAIVKLVASVNNVPESSVQFTNNNTTLAIVTNGYTQALNINDYAQVGTTSNN